MTIRQITIEDFPKLYSLWKKAGLEVKSIKVEKKELAQMIRLNSGSCLLVEQDNLIIGSALGVFNGRRAMVYHLAVDPDYQHKGYGSILLCKVEEALQKAGADIILLWVNYTNLKVLPFYLKKKYAVSQDALLLRKAL